MATKLAPNTKVVTRESKRQESEIGMLINKKILSFPANLGSSATDYAGNDESYIIIKINTSVDGSKLKEDKAAGDVYVADVQTGSTSILGKAAGIFTDKSKITNTDASTRYGETAAKKENWTKKTGLTRLDRVVVLPMPGFFTVDTDINYADSTADDVSRLTDALASIGDEGARSGIMKAIGTNLAGAALSGIGNAIRDKIGGSGRGNSPDETIRKAFAAQRIATNPKMEVLFENIGFRKFSWQWRLSPKNQYESDMIKEIVRTLRYYALPELNPGKLFYTFPAEFEIMLMKGAKENESIPKLSTCVLEKVGVVFGDSNTWSPMPDGSPPVTTLTLDIKELEIIDRNRIWNANSKITSGY